MRITRKLIETGYDFYRDTLFRRTQHNPELAHEMFIDWAQWVHRKGLEKILADCPENYFDCEVKFANAAGFNKNADIPPSLMRAVGFDIVVIGTVTYDAWKGNDPTTLPYNQRIWRHGEHLLENNLGLPGIGAPAVKRVLQGYDLTDQHIRLNWMSTPKKQGDELLLDIEQTVYQLREFVSSFELNISCPNTSHGGADTRRQYQDTLDAMLKAVTPHLQGKDLYLKIAPDLDRDEVKQILEVCSHYNIKGFTISNTTKQHKNSEGTQFGGGSGDFVYEFAKQAQTYFAEEIERSYSNKNWTINACGGIKNLERARERIQIGNVKEIQVFTPLIYEGPKLMRTLRGGLQNAA